MRSRRAARRPSPERTGWKRCAWPQPSLIESAPPAFNPSMTPGPIVLCAGELSGDMHAAHVVAELARRGAPSVVGMGGAHCAAAGMDVRFHHRDYAVIGFTGVLAGLPKF